MGDGDLVSLRLFLVAPDEAQQELWRAASGMASMPIEFEAGDAVTAKVALSRGGVDICVLDDALSETDRASVIKAARRKAPAPLLFLSSGRPDVRGGNMVNALTRPSSAGDAGKLIDICIRVKGPTPVLVVDDSDVTRGVVRKILAASRFDLQIHEAADSTSALEYLRTGGIGMVFVDYDMPGLNGADILSGIKRAANGAAIVIMATTTPVRDEVTRRRLAGTLGLLKKPFYPADVDAVLERYHGLSRPN